MLCAHGLLRKACASIVFITDLTLHKFAGSEKDAAAQQASLPIFSEDENKFGLACMLQVNCEIFVVPSS
jgi:hypothetical protein